MPTREQARALLDEGHSHEAVARELGIPAGLVYLLATGKPADGGDAPRQDLVNPPAVNPTRKASVLEWVKARAARDLTPAP